jgi:hypothetical protein
MSGGIIPALGPYSVPPQSPPGGWHRNGEYNSLRRMTRGAVYAGPGPWGEGRRGIVGGAPRAFLCHCHPRLCRERIAKEHPRMVMIGELAAENQRTGYPERCTGRWPQLYNFCKNGPLVEEEFCSTPGTWLDVDASSSEAMRELGEAPDGGMFPVRNLAVYCRSSSAGMNEFG